MIDRFEEALPVVVGQVHSGRFPDRARDAQIDRIGGEIGGKDLDAPLRKVRSEQIGEQERQRVSLFTRRTAGGPDTQDAPVLTRAVDELRKHVMSYKIEGLGIAEKSGYLDQEMP